ncbi:MAG: hypothetical protein FJ403_07920 [Verrucomicrobia bacterium]|nr:hypothetical protein [Verrucomicrobiota bacterium]
MSTTDVVIEKVKGLSEDEAKSVLSFIARLPKARRRTALELMLLPRQERTKILEDQMTKAAELYHTDPDLIMEVVDPPLEYEQS